MMPPGFGGFLISAVAVSLSGVVSPGPMTATTIWRGGRSRYAGALISVGHAVVEVPLALAIYFGASRLLEGAYTRAFIALAGGVYLIYLGYSMLRSIKDAPMPSEGTGTKHTSTIAEGMALSIGNPYFVLWWATVGLGLLVSARGFGLLGVAVFLFVHWLCDFLWYLTLSMVSHKGAKVLGRGFYATTGTLGGLGMLFFGLYFLYSAAEALQGSGI